jgi:hypothetical protein
MERRLYLNKGKEKRFKRKMEPEIAKIEKRDLQKDINNIGSGREGDREGGERGRGERERGQRDRRFKNRKYNEKKRSLK